MAMAMGMPKQTASSGRVMAAQPAATPMVMAQPTARFFRQLSQAQSMIRPSRVMTGWEISMTEAMRNCSSERRISAASRPARPSMISVAMR